MADHRNVLHRRASLGAVALALLTALPASAGEEEVITEKLDHGEVNWTEKTVMATGSGAPDLKLQNVAAVRLNAERAAKLAAYRNILEAIKGVRITASILGGEQLGQEQIRTQVDGIVRGCKTVDTRYYSDYGVDVVVKCTLDGGLATALAPPKAFKAVEGTGEKKYTGLIVDAVGLKAKPALAPRLMGPDGVELYAQEMVKPAFLRKHGPAAFVRTVESAKRAERVGATPLIIKAAALGQADSDVRISADEAAKLAGIDLTFLAEGRVVVATDGP